MHTKSSDNCKKEHFQLPENKPKTNKLGKWASLSTASFSLRTYLGWCGSATVEPWAMLFLCYLSGLIHHGNILLLTDHSAAMNGSHHSCQKPSKEQETWEIEGGEMLPNPLKKHLQIKGQSVNNGQLVFPRLHRLNICWSNKHSFPADCHHKVGMAETLQNIWAPQSDLFLGILPPMVKWNLGPTSFMLAIFYWAMEAET